eukprot:4125111-Prymnesium_polylepis.2
MACVPLSWRFASRNALLAESERALSAASEERRTAIRQTLSTSELFEPLRSAIARHLQLPTTSVLFAGQSSFKYQGPLSVQVRLSRSLVTSLRVIVRAAEPP